ACRVMRKLRGLVLAQLEVLAADAERDVPRVTAIPPVAVPLGSLLRSAEELDLHLLELAAPEREVARVDLVAERLADLPDAERHANPRRVEHVLEVHEDALRRFGAKVCDARRVLERADVGLEHQVERARSGQLPRPLRAL